jgi:protein-S-isoprenylcysteine O-methyltransferase Ste14
MRHVVWRINFMWFNNTLFLLVGEKILIGFLHFAITHPIDILSLILFLFWSFFELINAVKSIFNNINKVTSERKSYWLISISIWISLAFTFISKNRNICISNSLVSYLGLFTALLGLLIREISIFTLHRMYNVNVTVSGHKSLIKNGLYKYIRHPTYLGLILFLIGFSLSLGAIFSSIITIILLFFAINYRISIEEKALINLFGNEYIEYIKTTNKLFPFSLFAKKNTNNIQ